MRCHSISSITTDGYRAGSELGESLRAISREVGLLSVSIDYPNQLADVFLRTPSHFDPETGAVTMFGSPEKTPRCICSGPREEVLAVLTRSHEDLRRRPCST